MAQQTATQWLAVKLFNAAPYPSVWDKFIEQAKEMEKQQHINTWIHSRVEYQGDDYIGKEKTFDEYYNETFNKTQAQ